MSGYLQSARSVSVNSFIDWNVQWGPKSSPTLSTLPITSTESLMTYRSSGRYLKEIEGGALPIGRPKIELASRELGDTGHAFDHQKVERFTTAPRINFTTSYGGYVGPAFLDWNSSWQALPNSENTAALGFSKSQLNVLGAQGVTASYPTKPSSDLLVAVAELLREGLPSQLFSGLASTAGNSKRELLRSLSGDYLNLIFGISPLVREVDKLIKTVEKVNELISQLAADSGRLVRRARTIQESTTTVKSGRTSGFPFLLVRDGSLNYSDSSASIAYSQTLVNKVWFSGAFRYWIPNIQTSEMGFNSIAPGDYATSFDIATGIYGLRVTPKAAWNLLPFSWLVDWFLNVGSLLENLDAMTRYGLVMPYGYVMAEQKLISTTTMNLAGLTAGKYGSVSSSVVATRQQRERATPYGFGLKDVDLNPVQMSILAALGLQAGRR